jgi:ATP-dependent Clp protease ATP-binding subunit ClpC
MFERYTEKARRSIFFARYEASQFGSSYIEPEHLLLGLLREDKGLANRFLRSHAAIEAVREQIRAHTPPRESISTSVDLPLSHECKRALAYGAKESERLTANYIGTGHLLLGLLHEDRSYAAELLRERGVTLEGARTALSVSEPGHEPAGALGRFSRNLTQAALESALETNPSWDGIVDRVIDILWRRTKHWPVLICDSASAIGILERLAFRIAKLKVPEFFYNKQVFAVDIPRIASKKQTPAWPASILNAITKEAATSPNQIVYYGELEKFLNDRGAAAGFETILRSALYTQGDRLQGILSCACLDIANRLYGDALLMTHLEFVQLPDSSRPEPPISVAK